VDLNQEKIKSLLIYGSDILHMLENQFVKSPACQDFLNNMLECDNGSHPAHSQPDSRLSPFAVYRTKRLIITLNSVQHWLKPGTIPVTSDLTALLNLSTRAICRSINESRLSNDKSESYTQSSTQRKYAYARQQSSVTQPIQNRLAGIPLDRATILWGSLVDVSA